MPEFKSTYARLFVEFIKNLITVAKDIPNNNIALQRAAILNVMLSQMQPKPEDYRELNAIKSDIDSVIMTLQSIPSQSQSAMLFARQRDQLAERVKSANLVGEALITQFDELKTSTFNMITAVLDSIAKIDSKEKQQEKSSSQEIDNQLKSGEKSVAEFKRQEVKSKNERENIAGDLTKLFAASFAAVPSAQQANLPRPPQTTPGIIQRG